MLEKKTKAKWIEPNRRRINKIYGREKRREQVHIELTRQTVTQQERIRIIV